MAEAYGSGYQSARNAGKGSVIRTIQAIADHKAHTVGVLASGYTVSPDSAKPILIESLKEISFLGTSLSWAATFEIMAGLYLGFLVISMTYKGIMWLKAKRNG